MSNYQIKISRGMSIKDEERKERLDALALYMSPLPWFNIDLLHKLYINIFEKYFKKDLDQDVPHSFEMRSITCADLISSSDVIRIDYNAFELEKNKRELLRKEINEERKVLVEIGRFMMAYSESNHHHFLGPRYREVLNIEGLIIIDPSSAASEISSHISNQLNQSADDNETLETAEHYLKIINKQTRDPGIIELKKYLEGKKEWAKGNKENALQKFKGLKDGSTSGRKTITVKLPQSIQKEIIANFKKLSKKAVIDMVGRGICLIHVNKSIIGNGILLNGGYLLTANRLIGSIEDAKITNINFSTKNNKLDSASGVEYELDPSGYFITMSRNDLDFTIVKIKDHLLTKLSLIPVPTLIEDELIPRKNVIAIQITSQAVFKSGEGSIIDISDTRVYHDILLDSGGSGSAIFDQEGKILAMTVASNKSNGEYRAEAIRIDRIKSELNALGMDINNLEAQVKSSDLHCILVGNNEYLAENIYSLKGAIKDASRMRHFIQSNLNYASLKFIQNGSKQEIILAFEQIKKELKDGDTLLFYYAGYGGKEFGYFEKQTKFIATNDTLANTGETNRLAHFELQHLYQQCFEKDIQLVSILDCGYKSNPSRETNEITYYRSLPEVLKKRSEESMIYDEKFRPNEILNRNLISLVVANEDEEVLELETGGQFMNRFLKIQSGLNLDLPLTQSSNLNSGIRRGGINLHQLEEDLNAHNLENIEVLQSMEIFSYPNDDRETVLFKKQFLFGDQLVERRIVNTKDVLDLSRIDLTEVPSNIFDIENLKHLDLSNNKIEGGFSKLLVRENENIRWDRALRRLNKILILNVENNPIIKIEELALLVMICKDVRYSIENLNEKEKTFLEDLKLVVPIFFKKNYFNDYERSIKILGMIPDVPNLKLILDLIKSKTLQIEQLLQLLQHTYEAYEVLTKQIITDVLNVLLNLDTDESAQQSSENKNNEFEKKIKELKESYNISEIEEVLLEQLAIKENLDDYYAKDIRGQKWEYLLHRILGHIHNAEVRKIAIPAMLVRTVTPEVIQVVLTEPSGLTYLDNETAEKIFNELKSELALISKSFDWQTISFRQELRMFCEATFWERNPVQSRQVRDNAIKYYKNFKERSTPKERDLFQSEYYFHLLKDEQIPQELDVETYNRLSSYLEQSINELPDISQRYIRSLNRQKIDHSSIEQGTDQEWEFNFGQLIKNALNGELSSLKRIYSDLRSRRTRLNGGFTEFGKLEALLLQRLNKLKESNDLINGALKEDKDLKPNNELAFNFILLKIQNLEYQKQYEKAFQVAHGVKNLVNEVSNMSRKKFQFIQYRMRARSTPHFESPFFLEGNLESHDSLQSDFIETPWEFAFSNFKESSVHIMKEEELVQTVRQIRKKYRNLKNLEELSFRTLETFLKDITYSGEHAIVVHDLIYALEIRGVYFKI